jgi:hypothetical protein
VQLTSILATYSAYNTVVIVTREKYLIWRAKAGWAKQVMEVAMVSNLIVTTVFIDEHFILVGHSNGNLQKKYHSHFFLRFGYCSTY